MKQKRNFETAEIISNTREKEKRDPVKNPSKKTGRIRKDSPPEERTNGEKHRERRGKGREV